MSRIPVRLLLFALAFLLFVAGPSLLGFYTDWLWFGEVGYQHVYVTRLRSQGTLFTIVFALAAAWLTANVRFALRATSGRRPTFVTNQGIEVPLPGPEQLLAIGNVVVVLLSTFIGLYAANAWDVWLGWRHATPFNEADPLLGYDIAFYVFTLPFLHLAQGIAVALVLLAALLSGALYFVSGSLTTGFPLVRISFTTRARQHLSLLAATLFVLLAVAAWLSRPDALVQPSGLIHGAGYADVHARLPVALGLTLVALVGAALAAYQAFGTSNWPILAAAALYALTGIGGNAYAGVLQRFVVTPNEQARETPYLQHNITATRRAFGLDDIEVRPLSGDALLSAADIAANRPTLDNVRLWDHQPLLDTFGQIQEIRTYYDFVSVDNDRYRINGALRQVMLSARELNSNSLPNRTWVNERLTFTHGYGLTLGPVNQVTEEGLPVLFVRNLPPETTAGLRVDEPSLYFGELSNDYVIVRTNTREFHYPRGNDNEFTQYAGRGGLQLDSLWRKLVFALRFRAYQIVLSDDIQPESRIIFNRAIRDRVQLIAPFLTFDQDPYLVLADGRLVWMYDAYTTSSGYPYSTPSGRVNYIRNAVKFTIDAYDGTTTAYLSDPSDPIVQTWARIFPGTFKPMAEMPAALREHVRYPEDLFAVQSSVFATYHMTQPAVFYNREDQWEVPTIDSGGEAVAMQPYYTIMRLPGEQDAEFIQMLPFTPRRRDNLAAWLVARSDGDHYGKLRVFEFPKQKLVFGPRQVVARISQDQTIAPQITLWNQQGSQVIWGTLMVIPIEESLIYVRPLYLRAAGGRIPELRRVVVAYQNDIVMDETLDAALQRLFGEGGRAVTPRPAQGGSTVAQAANAQGGSAQDGSAAPDAASATAPAAAPGNAALVAEAQAHYDRAIEAQRAGDWAKYGEELRLLGQTLGRLRSR